ncbi:hypothetical protein [Salegentibacter chungangensis]|uniref:Peptidase M56 domain-containing protein n=1 Tax=Salegentibacter chungangensis TaxID=1335724 RepID=A0ABW3NQD8_9FLAO
MILIVNKYLPGNRFKGMVLWPFLFVKNPELKNDEIFINHERIHMRQQQELLILFFYIWYYLEYLFRLAKSGNRMQAYRNISFEREAYDRETIDDYLKERKFWAFLHYL